MKDGLPFPQISMSSHLDVCTLFKCNVLTFIYLTSPNGCIRLTVFGRDAAVDLGTDVLYPSMRVTHFRALYCKGIRLSCLNSLVRWNKDILQHLEVVDENYEWMDYIVQSENVDENQFLDPIIYAAWRCEMLQTIIIGMCYFTN